MPARAGGVGEQRREPLHPPVHRDVINVDAALGQQLLEIPIRQAVAQVPADRQRDHLRRETEPGKRRPVDVRTGRLELDAPAQLPQPGPTATAGLDGRNRPAWGDLLANHQSDPAPPAPPGAPPPDLSSGVS